MRDENRIDPLLEDLKKYWHENPDLRLGQIIINFLGKEPYNKEDAILHEKIKENLEKTDMEKRLDRMERIGESIDKHGKSASEKLREAARQIRKGK